MTNPTIVQIYPKYGGRGVAIEAKIKGERYILETESVCDLLQGLIDRNGFVSTKEPRQQIPRLIIKI